MRHLWRDLPEACDNTLLIAQRCDVSIELGGQLIPSFETPNGESEREHLRALVTAGGDTVVEYRGVATVDLTRASDGARLEELALTESGFETYSADGRSVTYDWPGTWVVVAFDEAGLPEAFVYLSGRLTETVTFAAAPQPGEELPAVVSAEITENSTEYVFDLCDLLDQAAETTTEEATPGTSAP